MRSSSTRRAGAPGSISPLRAAAQSGTQALAEVKRLNPLSQEADEHSKQNLNDLRAHDWSFWRINSCTRTKTASEGAQLNNSRRFLASPPPQRSWRAWWWRLPHSGESGRPRTQISAAQSQYGKKVTICHKGKTIKVSKHAVRAHLRHGDTLGPCSTVKAKHKKHKKHHKHVAKPKHEHSAKVKNDGARHQGEDRRREVEGRQARKRQGPGQVSTRPVDLRGACRRPGPSMPLYGILGMSGSSGRTTCRGPRRGSSRAACRSGRTAHRLARRP